MIKRGRGPDAHHVYQVGMGVVLLSCDTSKAVSVVTCESQDDQQDEIFCGFIRYL